MVKRSPSALNISVLQRLNAAPPPTYAALTPTSSVKKESRADF